MSDGIILIPVFLFGAFMGASLLAAFYADKVAKAGRAASELEFEIMRLRRRLRDERLRKRLKELEKEDEQ
jgi:hypothetical protein